MKFMKLHSENTPSLTGFCGKNLNEKKCDHMNMIAKRKDL